MKIIFDLRRVGLGDNGGSSTIINSANMLSELKNKVYIIDGGKNRHTWEKLKVPHFIVSKDAQIPDADAIIATGYKSVRETVSAPERCGIKFHWMRGWETWQMNEDEISKKILSAPTIKLVNGIGLQKKLEEHNCPSILVRPGYDIESYFSMDIRSGNSPVVLGGLYNSNRGNQIKRTSWIFETIFKIKSKRKDVQLWMFGTHKNPNLLGVDKYFYKPSLEDKNFIYNGINIWIAPTGLEGLHMPPAEAMLTECPVIGTNSKMNGMIDYLIHMKTGIVTKNDLRSFIKETEKFVDMRDLQEELGKKARKQILKLGSRKDNMKKLVKVLRGYLK